MFSGGVLHNAIKFGFIFDAHKYTKVDKWSVKFEINLIKFYFEISNSEKRR